MGDGRRSSCVFTFTRVFEEVTQLSSLAEPAGNRPLEKGNIPNFVLNKKRIGAEKKIRGTLRTKFLYQT
ncbi:MAG: hypothetical protein DRP97_02710 [Candidatus Latescibacterota bacterium]|nr:MAG: hypothetical protein B1H02_06160 [Candidatus Latescibacteria bacterium 4484_107]RKY71038.1 MAG: hypothetical protein DRP97_02710 [Candidatus Latescibacterota bacterium]